jgi:2-oxoglutarate/2-oxoacid ferredoxin oxidoreductase subunit alpha
MRKYRMDKATGKATFAIVQAEDEIASLGMVIGAGWAGARAMTSTSGPGISLMSEFAGLAYYAEVPGVVFDIQRVGPSTGLPTRTAQGDMLSTASVARRHQAHPADPASVEECYSMAMDAFDLAERFQTLVFVMSDLDLGMNTWMSIRFRIPTRRSTAASCSTQGDARAARRVGPLQGRGRRRHPVPHRAGRRHAGVLHARVGPQREGAVQRAARRLRREHGPAGAEVRDGPHTCRSPSSRRRRPAAEVGIIAYGTSHWAIEESRDQLEREEPA